MSTKQKAQPTKPSPQVAGYVATLWNTIVQVQAVRGQTTGEKVHETLERATTYLKRAAKLIGEEVA